MQENIRRRIELYQKTALFASFPAEQLAILAESSEILAYPKGGVVFKHGDPGDSLYLVASGEVTIRKESEGRSVTVASFIPVDCFGDLDFFSQTARNADAVAEDGTELLKFPASETSFPEVMAKHPALFAKILHAFLAIMARRIRSTNSLLTENAPWVRELKRQVLTDTLTGLYSKSFLEDEHETFLREPTALVMMKPDNFKELNDDFGHEAGDHALKLLAKLVAQSGGSEPYGIRYRGNELALVLPGTDEDAARAKAESMREAVKDIDLSGVAGTGNFRLKASFGVRIFRKGDWKQCIASTYELLYKARNDGGDRVYLKS